MKEIPNLDELLNSYIDDELPLRQHTEIQRLVAHDEKIAQRLVELRQCKTLVSCLPVAEAPPQILENVKASMAEPKVLDREPSILDKEPLPHEEKVGAWHLLGRKVFAAAAMFGLVAVLAAVVYSILAPTSPSDPIVVENITSPQPIDLADPTLVTAAVAPFSGQLELYTNNLPAVVGFINRAIEENIPSDEWIASDQSSTRKPHRLICTGESFNLLLARLDDIWDKLDSAALSIDTKVFGSRIVVDAVTTEQINDIVNQNNSTRRIEVARDFAVLNNMTEHLPGREILAAIEDNATVDLIVPPKPVLTSNHKTSTKTAPKAEADKNISLTIVVNSSN
jgi:hypothetical protein